MQIVMEDLLSKELRLKVRDTLRGHYGSVTRVAKATGIARQNVYLVLDGKIENDRVLQAAADEALRLMELRKVTTAKMQQVAAMIPA